MNKNKITDRRSLVVKRHDKKRLKSLHKLCRLMAIATYYACQIQIVYNEIYRLACIFHIYKDGINTRNQKLLTYTPVESSKYGGVDFGTNYSERDIIIYEKK